MLMSLLGGQGRPFPPVQPHRELVALRDASDLMVCDCPAMHAGT